MASLSSSATLPRSSSSLSFSTTSSGVPSVITSDLTPFPTTTVDSGPGSNFNNNNGNDNSPSLASSASLYRTSQLHSLAIREQDPSQLTPRPFNEIAVYTFLATLVLLLSVSAAIVIRSFLLRRRHRRMIEEAIRNGTYVPPAPTGRGGPRVDLSKKPRLWEAYMDLHHPQQLSTAMSMSSADDREWDSMKPLMASYVRDSAKTQNPHNATGGGGSDGMAGRSGDVDGRGGEDGLPRSRTLFGRLARGVRNAINPTPSGPTLPLAHPVSNGSGNDTRQGSALNLGANTANSDVQMTELEPPGPPKVRVAVLIAMPRAHSSSKSSSSSSTSPRSASTSSAASSASASASSPPVRTHINPSSTDEEEELPHVEMGVAELVVTDSHHLSHLDGDDEHKDAKGKVRESIVSVGSV